MKKMVAVLAGAMMMTMATSAMAITLSSDNSSALIANDGAWVDWNVNGVDSMFQTNFFYQINNGTIYSLNNSPYSYGYAVAPSTISTFSDTDYARITYTNNQIKADIKYNLTGTGTGQVSSDMGLLFGLTNKTNQSMNVRLFQYVDLDVSNTAFDDYASKGPGQKLNQWDSKANVEMVYTPNVTAWQINGFSSPNLYNLQNLITATGADDYRWMLAWDWQLASGSTATMSEDFNMQPVPEPGTMVLLGFGLFGLAVYGKRRMNNQA